MRVRKLGESLGAEVEDIDLTTPLDSSSLEKIEQRILFLYFEIRVFPLPMNLLPRHKNWENPCHL